MYILRAEYHYVCLVRVWLFITLLGRTDQFLYEPMMHMDKPELRESLKLRRNKLIFGLIVTMYINMIFNRKYT